jgi:hypothetical protein
MRKPIGNITILESQKVEEDPQRERMRLDFIKERYLEKSKDRAINHIKKMCDSEKIGDVFKGLFSQSGRPPANLSLASMVEQYESLIGKRKWLMAFIQELSDKFKELDNARYDHYVTEKKQKEKQEEEKRQEAFLEYTKTREKLLKPVVQQKIREVTIRKQSVYKMKRELDREGVEILGSKRIENTMNCLFAEYIKNPKKKLDISTQERCNKIVRELAWLEVSVLEMEQRICDLNELIESAHIYLNKVSDSFIKNSDWKRVRELEVSKEILY